MTHLYEPLAPTVDDSALTEQIRHWAQALGLTVGFAQPNIPPRHQDKLALWLSSKHHADMSFFDINHDLRTDPKQLYPGTLSIISARINYWHDNGLSAKDSLNNPNMAYISRYALGRDYHKVLRQKLKQLCLRIEQEIGTFQWRPFSDSAPIMEHALAEQAGLGFIGKNTLLIHPQAGSTFFLGEILCDLALTPDEATEKCGCGPCTNCITDCPTGAIIAPFTVDAAKCISYLTIEFSGTIPLHLRPLMGNRIYGCDDCQLTCPWNKFAQVSVEADFLPRHQLDQQTLLTLWQWLEDDFLKRTEGSPIRRIGYQQWRRNLAVALGNAPANNDIINALTEASIYASALVKEHIEWAIEQHKQPHKPTQPTIDRYYINFAPKAITCN